MGLSKATDILRRLRDCMPPRQSWLWHTAATNAGNGGGGNNACSQIATGVGASLNGFLPFPANSLWNQDMSAAPVDANSTGIINFIGGNAAVHPDFGAGLYTGGKIGIPYVVVSSKLHSNAQLGHLRPVGHVELERERRLVSDHLARPQ